jgi:plastocyanin
MAVQDRPVEAPPANEAKRRIAGLDWLMLIGVGVPFAAFLTQLTLFTIRGHTPPPPLIIFTVLPAICFAAVLTGWRWSMIVAVVLVVLPNLALLGNPFISHALTHPSDNLFAFSTFAVTYASAALVAGAALVKLVRTVRGQPNEISQGMVGFTSVVAGFLVGYLLLGFIGQGSAGASASANTAGNENVSVVGSAFAPNIVALHTGDTLTITDQDSIPHILTNGTWSSDNKPVPGVEPGAVILSNLSVSSGSKTVGPFTTPGTYHIYCTVHAGMQLTIVVQ